MKLNKSVPGGLAFAAACITFSSTTWAATNAASLDDAIRGANISGQFRLGYINNDPDVAGSTSTSAAAIGGYIKLETKPWNRLTFALAPYFSEKIEALSGDEASGKLNGDFFDSNNDSLAYFGEAYVQYNWANGNIRYGRQVINTPFINCDDLRMLKHTYEAAWLNHRLRDNLYLEGGLVKRWSGFNTGVSQGKFERASNDGVLAVGATYQMKDHHTFHAWYYDFDKNYSQLYFDGIYANGNFEAGVQYSDYSEDNGSNVDGSFHGLTAQYTIEPVTLSLAYNKASNDAGKSVSAGLGVGNFFTTMDDSFIADKTDAEAYRLAVDYAINKNLNLNLAYGHFEDANKTTVDTDELNLIVTYNLTDSADIEYIHVEIDNKASPADTASNLTRELLRVNYRF